MSSESAGTDNGRCDHEWIPFGLKLYNPGDHLTDEGRFYRVEDVRCLRCGGVENLRELSMDSDRSGGEP